MDFKNENGSEFVGIRNYSNKFGEISNQTLNVGIDVLEAKKKDLKSLKNLSIDNLYNIADDKKIDRKIADKAIAELLVSGLKNVSTEIKNRTVASQSQSDAYEYENKAIKFNKESGYMYVAGFVVAKTILTDGIYPTVKSQDKTILKNAIKKALNFKMNNYRTLFFKEAKSYKINGNEIIVK